ncbi:sulfite exporter TauE/SafE family protein [Sneathiella chinensis]|uniref:Probable membrane transporter protein n=1 Tax=Sneathiella chinensis TaxID=349750 RepID=A0ABQ5U2L3_9PROT|nr:sulfite exporter TauE/SafE family protein [Sneathiella chinensis]GLQ05661.1 UPF0721 transmembrane protein [Sneathiella chinensis]
MDIIADPLFYSIAIPAILIVGISKGGFAGSLGMLGVPLMSLAIPPVQAAAIILPILCLMDIFGLIAYRRLAHWRNLAYLLPGAIFGILAGSLLFQFLNDDIIRITVGAIAVLFTLNHWLVRRHDTRTAEPNMAKGSFWGMISGFTSFVSHAGGPPLQFYLLPQKIDKTLFVGTTVWFYLVVNYVKLIPYTTLGLFSLENIGTSLVLLPLAPLGIWLGVKAHKKVSDALFFKLAYLLLFITGVKLLWDGLTALVL